MGEETANQWEELNKPRGPDFVTDPPPPPLVAQPAPSRRHDPFQLLLAAVVAFVLPATAFMILSRPDDELAGPDTTLAQLPFIEQQEAGPEEGTVEITGTPTNTSPPTSTSPPTNSPPTSLGPPTGMTVPAQLLDAHQSKIYRLYLVAFGRSPDAGGFDYWTQQFRDGVRLVEIADRFSQAAEFQAQFGSGRTDAEIVDALYSNLIGGPGDPKGVGFWLGQRASGMTLVQLIVSFSESDESVRVTGTRH